LEKELAVYKRAYTQVHHWYVHYCNKCGFVAKGSKLWLEEAREEAADE